MRIDHGIQQEKQYIYSVKSESSEVIKNYYQVRFHHSHTVKQQNLLECITNGDCKSSVFSRSVVCSREKN